MKPLPFRLLLVAVLSLAGTTVLRAHVDTIIRLKGTTLTGLPKELFFFWRQYLQPRGYKLRFQIVDFPNGMPGDIGVTLSWR